MRRVVLSCLAGVLVGLVVILLPLAIFESQSSMAPATLGQKENTPSVNTRGDNATSAGSDLSGGAVVKNLEPPGIETTPQTLRQGPFWVSNPLESLGLTSVSMLFAFSIFITSRHALRRGKAPRK